MVKKNNIKIQVFRSLQSIFTIPQLMMLHYHEQHQASAGINGSMD